VNDWNAALRPSILLALIIAAAPGLDAQDRPRARELGITVGALEPGPRNTITDVVGVRVGHATVIRGDSIRTGVTAIFSHPGNAFRSRVPAAIVVGNGFGKLIGSTQVNELGELETPILLTCTLCVWRAAESLAEWMIAQPGMEKVRSINPVVGETNDGWALNAIRGFPITRNDVQKALTSADTGMVAEGSVGAGTGTVAYGWKGGIGTSSRVVKVDGDTYTVGALVQTNFGGWRELVIAGVPVGQKLGRGGVTPHGNQGSDGSVIVVLAADAPITERNLRRLASRALLGLGRTGSSASNGSGDYVIAFSTNLAVRRGATASTAPRDLANDQMSVLFDAAADATEEAVYNSLLRATTVKGAFATVEAIPVEDVRKALTR
jgi:D-aminopeptidase